MIIERSLTNAEQQTATDPALLNRELNDTEIRCGMCGKIGYVREETFRFVIEAIQSGQANPFRCEVCKEKVDER